MRRLRDRKSRASRDDKQIEEDRLEMQHEERVWRRQVRDADADERRASPVSSATLRWLILAIALAFLMLYAFGS